MPFSDAYGNQIVDHIVGNGALAQPAALWIGLAIADGTEVSGAGYSRVQCDNWDAAASRETKNSIVIDFPEATGDWGGEDITKFHIFTAETGGSAIYTGTLNNAKRVTNGVDTKFAIGSFKISIASGALSNYLANAILDHVFKNSSFTPPANLYVFFTTAAINDGSTGSTITEPGDTYERQNVNDWDAAVGQLTYNTNYFAFPEAAGTQGEFVGAGVADALTGGNILFYATTDTAHAIAIQDTPEFNAGEIELGLS